MCVLAAATFLAGPTGLGAQDPGDDLRQVTLQLKWRHQFQFAGYYAAVERGYYREAGLDVTLVEAAHDEDPVEVVIGGYAEFGVGTSELVLAHGLGKPVVLVAPIFQHSPLVFLARADQETASVHDLIGRRVAVEQQAAELIAYMKREGMTLADIEVVPHAFNVQPLLAGDVDAISAYLTDEPFIMRETGVPYLVFNPRASGIDFYGDSLFTSEEVATRDPELVRTFLEASLRGWAYALANPEEIVELIYTQYSQRHSREHLLFEAHETRRLILPEIVELGYVNPDRLRHIAEVYVELGMLDAMPDLGRFVFRLDPDLDLRKATGVVVGLLVLLLIVGGVGLRFYQLNVHLGVEVEERKRTEERYRVLVEHAPFPIAITSVETDKVLFLNPTASRLLRISAEEARGRDRLDFCADSEDRHRLLADENTSGEILEYETRMRRADGSLFWAMVSSDRIEFEKKLARFVTFSDVTERRRAEEQLRETHRELVTLMDSVPALIARIDRESRVILANSMFGQWLGVKPQDIVGSDLGKVLCPDSRTTFAAHVVEAFGDKPVEFEEKIATSKGLRHVRVQMVPHHEHGEIVALLVVATDITSRKAHESDLRRLATLDGLTKLFNRRETLRMARADMLECRERELPLTIAMTDIDHFKKVNDEHGHAAGDEVLRQVADTLRRKVRDGDTVGRIGGEEFLVVMPGNALPTAIEVVGRLKSAIEELEIMVDKQQLRVTMSFGVAEANAKDAAIEDVMRRADEALYKAKRGGRNRVDTWVDEEEEDEQPHLLD